jgi:thiol-disulfide isomerase/thioredoxin
MRGLAVALIALLAACSGQAAGNGGLPTAGVAAVSGTAPAIRGELLATGAPLPAGSLRNKVLVVNFWNPYCPPCRDEAPALERAARRFSADGVVVLGVHYTGGQWPTSLSAARRFLKTYRVSYPVIGDPGSKLAIGFAIQGIPSTVLVDRTGRMRYRILGRAKTTVLDDLLSRLSGAT